MLLQNSNAISSDGYVIDNSLRFSAASSQYLTRLPSVASNRGTWTWSGWVKRGTLGGLQTFFCTNYVTGASVNGTDFRFDTTDALTIVIANTPGGIGECVITTTRLFRDVSAYYHIVVRYDTTQSTASDRVSLYVNGERITSFSVSSYPPQNNATATVNNTQNHHIGCFFLNGSPTRYFDGYVTEVNFIDGQALTPSSFSEINPVTGQWVAKKYTGTYGTNGFYLDFKNGTTTTTLGQDKSGNSNNWTLTNFTRSAGVNDCWMKDVPAGNGEASAVQPSGNYAVLNPLVVVGTTGGSTSGGNLTNTGVGNPTRAFPATIAASSGKFYAEFVPISISFCQFGVKDSTLFPYVSGGVNGSGAITWDTSASGTYFVNGSSSAPPVTVANNDVIMVAFDVASRQVWFGKNGVWNGAGSPATGTNQVGVLNGTDAITFFCRAESTTAHANFGQRSFAYTPPAGFKALCTSNLPNPAISKPENHFDTILWTGNNSTTRAITGLNFSPDFTWIKCRSKNYDHHLVNSLRGSTNSLISNSAGAEVANDISGYVSSLDSNGFTVSFGTTDGQVVNESPQNYVAWNWRASDSTSTTNTDGSITSTVSANPDAGFSIVTYTGTGANATVGHGLGKIPALIIVKNATNGTSYWCVQHKSLPVPSVLRLNETTASASATNIWTSNNNTSLIFNIGAANETNRPSNTMVAYCFAEIDGYSKFGSYTGNGSADGPFVHCGFRPAFVMIKCSSTGGTGYDWVVNDTSRDQYNVASLYLQPNTSLSESSTPLYDILSNGFKLRNTNVSQNANGATYIYMAFADSPFQYSNAR